MAKASSMSISRAMGEWLGDTVEAAEFMAKKLEQARAAPKIVVQEMHAYALGLSDETGKLMEQLRQKGRVGGSAASGPSLHPPSGNTGGKGHKSTTQGPRGRK
jgi:hypothetical protein